MSNSSLASVKMISPNRTVNRNSAIEYIIPHVFVGQVTAEQGAKAFQSKARNASCNYVIGFDGSIALVVEEKDRSWCTGGLDAKGNPIRVNGISGKSMDYRAITIEVASGTEHPYAVTDAAYNALIKLCADICRRNNIKELKWKGDKSLVGNPSEQNLAVHRWFAAKACPGEFLYNRMGDLAKKVNDELNGVTATKPASSTVTTSTGNYVVRVTANILNVRSGPGTDYKTTTSVSKGQAFTITEERTGKGANKWGKLKSGAGWISLDYTKKV